MFDEEMQKKIAQNLKKPEGDFGRQVGADLNNGNRIINLLAIGSLDIRTGDNILEIGMGNGYFAQNILAAADNVRYTGCDYSDVMVEEAIKLNHGFIESGKAGFFLCSAEKMPFEDSAFDKVFTVNTIYFWDDPSVELAEIRRVLKPEGMLVIAIRPRSVTKNISFTKYGFKTYSQSEVTELLNANGFKVAAASEGEEPEQEINGQPIKLKNLIVTAIAEG